MTFSTTEECLKEWKNELEKEREFYEENFNLDESGFDIIMPNGSEYGIEWCRFDSHKKVLGWIAHLREKTWFREDSRYEDTLLKIAINRLNDGKGIIM